MRSTPTESQSSIPFTHALLHTMSAERNKRQCVHAGERKQRPIYHPTDDKWPPIGSEEEGILEIKRQRCD